MLNLHNVKCQIYLNKTQKDKKKIVHTLIFAGNYKFSNIQCTVANGS